MTDLNVFLQNNTAQECKEIKYFNLTNRKYEELLNNIATKRDEVSDLINELYQATNIIKKINDIYIAAVLSEKEKSINLHKFLQQKVLSMINILSGDQIDSQILNTAENTVSRQPLTHEGLTEQNMSPSFETSSNESYCGNITLVEAQLQDVQCTMKYKYLQQRLEDLYEDCKQSVIRILEQDKTIESNMAKIEELKRDLSDVKCEAEGLQREVNKLSDENKSLMLLIQSKNCHDVQNNDKSNEEDGKTVVRNLQTRLRLIHQALSDNKKILKDTKKQLDEKSKQCQLLKERLKNTESANQRKQILIDSVKNTSTNLERDLEREVKKNVVLTAETNKLKECINNLEEQISYYKQQIFSMSAEMNMKAEGERRNRLEIKVSQLLEEVKEKSKNIARMKNENINKIREVSEYYERNLSEAHEQIKRLDNIRKEFSLSIESFLGLVNKCAIEKTVKMQEKKHSKSQREAHGKACSILKITPNELRRLIITSDANIQEQILRIQEEYVQIINCELFSEKLSKFLLKATFSFFKWDTEKQVEVVP